MCANVIEFFKIAKEIGENPLHSAMIFSKKAVSLRREKYFFAAVAFPFCPPYRGRVGIASAKENRPKRAKKVVCYPTFCYPKI